MVTESLGHQPFVASFRLNPNSEASALVLSVVTNSGPLRGRGKGAKANPAAGPTRFSFMQKKSCGASSRLERGDIGVGSVGRDIPSPDLQGEGTEARDDIASTKEFFIWSDLMILGLFPTDRLASLLPFLP